jgi:predicted pyridoxine 5'-phosphate oxidase superfamily flavin-nucleotide-binding protein
MNLFDLREHIEGMVPPTLTTADEHGVPNVIHISHAMVIDKELIGLSRQFLRKTLANLERDPRASLFITDQKTYDPYLLHIVRVRVETSGPYFEAMSARVDAMAAASGMSTVFKVQALDVFRVSRIERVPGLVESDAP